MATGHDFENRFFLGRVQFEPLVNGPIEKHLEHVVQRYLAAKSTREARKGAVVGALLSTPTWVFFFFIGTALWVYYHVNPDPQVAQMEADRVFPHFILTKFPIGITGCVVAAIISAAMSSLDSSINGLSTVTVTNIIRKHLAPGRGERFYLRWARLVGCVCGVIMILGALVFRMLPANESIANLQNIIFALFGGCVTSFFLLGFLTKRVHYASTMVALAASILLNVYLLFNSLDWLPAWMQLPVHEYWVNILVNACFMVVAYGLSALWHHQKKNLSGLTLWTAERTGQ